MVHGMYGLLGQGRKTKLTHVHVAHIKILWQLEFKGKASRISCPSKLCSLEKVPINKNIYSIFDSEIYTFGSFLVLWNLYSVLRFSLCDLWEKTESLMEIYVCNKGDPLPTFELW